MSYKKLIRKESSIWDRAMTYNYYYNKYFNLFMNAYKWSGIDYQQIDYVMRRFWSDGAVASFIVKHTKGDRYPNGMIAFTPFAPIEYNINDFPTKVTLVNKRGVSFIPTTPQKVDEEVVIGYAQRNKKPVGTMVEYYLQKITDIEMTIRTNLKAQKTPYVIGVTPESESKVKALWDSLESDDPVLWTTMDEANSIIALNTGANYTIDKLHAYKVALENELKEFLGINNIGVTEKKEHLIGDEVEANNEVVANSSDCFLDVLKEFCQRVSEILDYPISVELNQVEEKLVDVDEEENQDDIQD